MNDVSLKPRVNKLKVCVLLIACYYGLNACTPNVPILDATATLGVEIDNHFPHPVTLTPTPDKQAGRVYVPDISSSDGPQVLAAEVEPSPTPSLVVTPPISTTVICSPLAFVSIEELPDVVSGIYAPPPPGKDDRHQGVDLSYWRRGERTSILGDGVQAVFAGYVAGIVVDRYPYGNMIMVESRPGQLPEGLGEAIGIQAGESLYVLYAHMQTPPNLQLGEEVSSCQLLDTVGKSGNAGVAHLHLEARLGPVDSRFGSMAYYIESASLEERQTYVLWRTSGVYRHLDPMILFKTR
jgi:murein DD-endopeptidase MepM/ murein hydrolase activator NlpD